MGIERHLMPSVLFEIGVPAVLQWDFTQGVASGGLGFLQTHLIFPGGPQGRKRRHLPPRVLAHGEEATCGVGTAPVGARRGGHAGVSTALVGMQTPSKAVR